MPKTKTPSTYKPIFDYIDQAIKPLATKEDVNHLSSKNLFYKVMDQVMGELKTIREEQIVTGKILKNHEDPIDTVEQKLQIIVN